MLGLWNLRRPHKTLSSVGNMTHAKRACLYVVFHGPCAFLSTRLGTTMNTHVGAVLIVLLSVHCSCRPGACRFFKKDVQLYCRELFRSFQGDIKSADFFTLGHDEEGCCSAVASLGPCARCLLKLLPADGVAFQMRFDAYVFPFCSGDGLSVAIPHICI